ncbi:MAG TPA: FAD-dependent monooxygenase, partial [Streptosporangiaceae bacterium]|nr:FAD-dependent monooxygenase [Streptosporangiaceae bacterium]
SSGSSSTSSSGFEGSEGSERSEGSESSGGSSGFEGSGGSGGSEREVRALLTVAADGRHSVLRRAAGLRLQEFGAPIDVAWFRLPRLQTDRQDTFLRVGTAGMLAAINRTTYWQLARLMPKGGYDALQAGGADALRQSVTDLLPFLADRAAEIDFDRVRLLSVRVDRLRRWHRPGFLCIGDAAHAMSPIGGAGINLAIQDAVAAANLLYTPLSRGLIRDRDLAAVRRRRCLATAAVQTVQLGIQNLVIEPALRGRQPSIRALKTARRFPPFRRLLARAVGYGPLPEHVRTPPSRRS